MKSLKLALWIAIGCAFALVVTGKFFSAALAVLVMFIIFKEIY